MMGSETDHDVGSTPTAAAGEEMESVILTDSFRSAVSSSVTSSTSSSFHPLVSPVTTAITLDPISTPDPLLPSPRSQSSPLPHRRLSNSPSSSFVDPPSYADVVFSPFYPENGTGESNHASSSSSSLIGNGISSSRSGSLSRSIYARITVSDPQKEMEATNSLVGSTYVTYMVTTRTSDTEYSVRRRFRDFVTLADRLAEAYRGFFIPVRPDKNVVESQVMQRQDFVEQRRVALQKYLRRLAVHPAVGGSEELRVFLQVHGKLPLLATTDMASRMLDGAVRLPKQLFGETRAADVVTQDVTQPAKGGRDLLRIFKELKQSMTNDWSGTKPLVVEEDKKFLERKEKLQDLEQQLSTSSQQAETLVKAQQDIGETMGELGLTFIKLTKFETDEAVYNCQRTRAAEIRRMATAAVKASRFYRELNSQMVKHLDTLHEYLGMMLAVHSAFSDRSNALLTVQTLLSEINSLQIKTEKLEAASSKIFGGDRSRIRKVEELKDTMKATEDAKNVAIREYDRIKENNRTELQRLDREKHDDFLGMLKGFVVNQVGYAEKISSVWEQVAEETSGYARQKGS